MPCSSYCGRVSFQRRAHTVPVALDRLGVERAHDAKVLAQAMQEPARRQHLPMHTTFGIQVGVQRCASKCGCMWASHITPAFIKLHGKSIAT